MSVLIVVNTIRIINDIFIVNYLFSYVQQGYMFDMMLYSAFAVDIAWTKVWLIIIKMYANLVWDPKVASTQITFIQSSERFINIIPRIYTYKIVDLFGLHGPNFIAGIISIGLSILVWPKSRDPELSQRMEMSKKQELNCNNFFSITLISCEILINCLHIWFEFKLT